MTDIATIPAIRAEAQRLAREAHDLFALLTWGVEDGWSELDDDAQATLVQVHAALLSRLDRPASRDAIARLVAAKLGLVCGATAPTLRRSEPYWCLCAGPQIEDGEEWDGELDFGPSPSGDWEHRRIPELAGVTDPAQALATVALAVLGGEE